MSIRLARGIALVGASALWAACAKNDSKSDSAAAADSAAKAAAAAPAAAPAPAPPALTDANIAALLDEANAGDSAAGNLASTKGTNAQVKDFGRTMMRDHHALRKAGQDLAKKLNLTPAPPSNDTLPQAAQKMHDSLNAMPKGAAQDTSLKALITKATPNIQAHLTKAQDIQSKLGAAPAAAATDAGKKASGDSSKKKNP